MVAGGRIIKQLAVLFAVTDSRVMVVTQVIVPRHYYYQS